MIAAKAIPTDPSSPEATVKLSNTNDAKFPATQFPVPRDHDIDIDATKQEWANYFKAGLRVALKFLRERTRGGNFVPASIEAVLDGSVPPGGGVSSSAALVCASALAVVKANGHDMTKQELFDTSIVSERAVGVYSGG